MPSIDKEKALQAVAYREAGQAVAAWLKGIKFLEVSIIPMGTSLGNTLCATEPRLFHPDLDLSPRVIDRIERHILICFAGPAAVARSRGRHNWRGAGEDMHQAADLITLLCGSLEEEEAYLNLIRIRAEGLVEAPYLFHRALQQSPELVEEALQRRLALPVNQVGYRRQLRAPLRWSSLRRLPRLRVPTLVLHGDHDRLIPDINGRLIARLIPGARFYSIKGAGHVYSTDAPGEAAAEVLSFIESQVKRRSGKVAGGLQASAKRG